MIMPLFILVSLTATGHEIVKNRLLRTGVNEGLKCVVSAPGWTGFQKVAFNPCPWRAKRNGADFQAYC